VVARKDAKEEPKPHPKRLEKPHAKRPKAPDKDLDKLVKQAWEAGWWCWRGSKYIYCDSTDRTTRVKIAMTPSDWRTLANTKRDFRSGGLSL
jgi:hypothetical protein